MGIVRKSFFAISGILIITILILLSILYYAFPIYQSQSKTTEMRSQYLSIVKELNQLPVNQMIQIISKIDIEQTELYLTLTDIDGNILYPESNYEIDLSNDTINLSSENHYFSEIITSNNNVSMILIGQYIPSKLKPISQLLLTYYPFVIVLFILFTLFIAYSYSFLSTRRLNYISEQTKKMQYLSPEVRSNVTGKDEIAQLSKDIDVLYETLLFNLEKVKKENQLTLEREKEKDEFLRIASHELKTPITSMMGIVEGMKYKVGDFKNYDKYLDVLNKILKEQMDLVYSLLDISSLDLQLSTQLEKVDIKQIIHRLLPLYEYDIQTKNYQLIIELDECQQLTSPIYIEKVIKNLLDNAFRYTPANGKIQITLNPSGLEMINQTIIELTDEQMKQLTQPFYRPDYSRNRQDGGTGLGMFFVAQILDKLNHRYSIHHHDKVFIFKIDF